MTTDVQFFGSENMLNIDGLLTNAAGGSFTLFGPGDTATIGQLSNSGVIDLESGSILNISGWLFKLGGGTSTTAVP